MSSSLILQNTASSPSYSTISLQDRIHADVHDTVFRNNSALVGGAMFAQDECRVTLKNCTLTSNKAITAKALSISKNPNLQRSAGTPDQNVTKTVANTSPTLFNETSSDGEKTKTIATHLLRRRPILSKTSVRQEDALLRPYPGYGGAIYVAIQSQLLMTSCTFKDNAAQSWGGAIITKFNVTLRVQETTFVGNKAQYAGAIVAALNATLYVEETTFVGNKAPGQGGAINFEQVNLRMKHCLFDDNISEGSGGAIWAVGSKTLDIQETNFTGNRAEHGGAINVAEQSYLRIKDCVFDNNTSERLGGAIVATFFATLEIQETNFTGNRAEQGGAIDVEQQSYLCMTDCTFEDNRAEQIGGGIVGGFEAVLEINGSYFSTNSAFYGGAINAQLQTNLTLTNCRFERNFASDSGGAVSSASVVLKIQETNFTGNGAPRGGGALYVSTLTDCHVVRCVFNYNTANGAGGAVYIESQSSLQLKNTNFINNNATDGGAFYIDLRSELQANMCSFWKNLGKRNGGAIKLNDNSTAIIESCQFLSNYAISGWAVDVNYPKHFSVLSTFLLRNVASYMGGAISISNGANVIINNITCVGNQGQNGGGCMNVDSVTLILNNSEIRQNFANGFGAGVCAVYSRIQVCAKLTNETRFG